MGGKILKFVKNPKFLHKRSEGLTSRGEARQEFLQRGPAKRTKPCSKSSSSTPSVTSQSTT